MAVKLSESASIVFLLGIFSVLAILIAYILSKDFWLALGLFVVAGGGLEAWTLVAPWGREADKDPFVNTSFERNEFIVLTYVISVPITVALGFWAWHELGLLKATAATLTALAALAGVGFLVFSSASRHQARSNK